MIDFQVRAEDESILANLKQYNCASLYIDVAVSDFSCSIWHSNIKFDSIITDRKFSKIRNEKKIQIKFAFYF